MIPTIITLLIVGFLLLGAEVFLPGMIVGAVGFLCLCVAVGLSYYSLGVVVGTYIAVGVVVFTLTGFVLWMLIFPSTPIGKRLTLQREIDGGDCSTASATNLLGKRGLALSPLRPAGFVRIENKKVDVVTDGDFLQVGQEIEVIEQEGMRIVVRAV